MYFYLKMFANEMKTINLYDEFLNQWSEIYFAYKYNYVISLLDKNDKLSSYHILLAKLSRDPNITLNTVKKHPEVDWNHEELSLNPNITLNMVKTEKNINWSEYLFSANPNVTIEIVKKNPDIEWNYYAFSSNENVTWELVKKNQDIAWNYLGLSINPNITVEIVGDDLMDDPLWEYECLTSVNKIIKFKTDKLMREFVNIRLREKFQEWFSNSELKQELLAYVWRPENIKNFKCLDSNEFGKGFN